MRARLSLAALTAAVLLPCAASAGSPDLWGASSDSGSAHATRAQRIEAVAAEDRRAAPAPVRRGSFVVVDGVRPGAYVRPGASPRVIGSFGGSRVGGLEERVRGTASLRLETRPFDRYGSNRYGSGRYGSAGHRFGDRTDGLVIRGGTGGVLIAPELPRRSRFDRGFSDGLDCRPDAFSRRFDRGGFVFRSNGRTTFLNDTRGYGSFDRGHRSSGSFDRGFDRGYDAGRRDAQPGIIFRYGNRR